MIIADSKPDGKHAWMFKLCLKPLSGSAGISQAEFSFSLKKLAPDSAYPGLLSRWGKRELNPLLGVGRNRGG
jgi:hypothetical protein